MAAKKQDAKINLEAPSYEQAQAWLSALNTLILNQRRKKDSNFAFESDGLLPCAQQHANTLVAQRTQGHCTPPVS
jgi:hypothetical protein